MFFTHFCCIQEKKCFAFQQEENVLALHLQIFCEKN